MDVYRQDVNPIGGEDLNPYRGNVYKTVTIEDEEVKINDTTGGIVYRNVDDDLNRRNYRQADNINYLDGDWASLIDEELWKNGSEDATSTMYPKKTGENYSYSMVGDHARVYKGGSWIDPQYYAAPGQRRWMEEDESAKNIGFRCAMARLGTPSGGGVKR